MLIRKDGSMVDRRWAMPETDDGAHHPQTYAGRAIFRQTLLADVRDPARRQAALDNSAATI